MQTVFELVTPRADVLAGATRDSDFAADLAQVLRGVAPPEYGDPALFFANTHPTDGLKKVLANVCARLTGRGHAASAVFRLDTQYGGGKTHALIALLHAARGMDGIANVAEFLDPALVPTGRVRVAAFDGENADPVNGREVAPGVFAFTPWGELAFALAGPAGLARVRQSDEARVAPGADTLRELFGGEPTLILLDELSIYLRKVRGRPDAEQLTPFLTGLIKAVESSPGAALVFTLAIGKHQKGSDAYGEENTWLASRLDEAESVAARKATLLDPTAEHEVAEVLRRRLFARIDDDGAKPVVAAYAKLWRDEAGRLPKARLGEDLASELARGYPFHPALMGALTDKLSTLANFQRVRGMLRLLTQTVSHLWRLKPAATFAVHLHHLDPGHPPIRNEIVTRLELSAFDPALRNDVTALTRSREGGDPSLAESLDQKAYAGLPPYASFVARTILWNTFAFNEHLKGVTPEELRLAILAPGVDPSFIDDARQRFVAESAYLDDRPTAPLRFLTEANLTMVLRNLRKQIDPEEARSALGAHIKAIFDGKDLALVAFPGGPYDVDDAVGDGRPRLVVLSYDAASVQPSRLRVPDMVERLFRHKGQAKGAADQHGQRNFQNNLVFLVADETLKSDMTERQGHRMALGLAVRPEHLKDLVEHQQNKVRELHQRSELELAVAIQQCYRHLFFPSRHLRIDGAGVELGHVAFDVASASEKPGAGQARVLAALSDHQKLVRPGDPPLAAAYIRDKTPLRLRPLSSEDLRNEFRKDPALPILLNDSSFIELLRKGISEGLYVYQRGDLLWGPGDVPADLKIEATALVMTVQQAKEQKLWPRKAPELDGSAGDPEAPQPERGVEVGSGGGLTRKGISVSVPPAHAGREAAGPATFTVEAPLGEALTRIWEQARQKRVGRLASLTLRLFEAQDAFRLVSAVGGALSGTGGSGAGAAVVTIRASYEGAQGASLELEFRGPPEEAIPVKDFLEPQLRAMAESSCETSFELTFAGGLALDGDLPEKLTQRLSRFSTGAAQVQAFAVAQP
ncbi:MAG: DUF499 domain-containing protein [Deltaproteobacteria bacterium]|nr:DUF499 domain-containing protein [Deltaproteobacteria bacterium]